MIQFISLTGLDLKLLMTDFQNNLEDNHFETHVNNAFILYTYRNYMI